MTLGASAGRSAGNRPRASARRRNSIDEREKTTHLYDDPQQWPDEPVHLRGWRKYVHDVLVGLAATGWILFFMLATEMATGWAAVVMYGFLTATFVTVSLIAFGSRRSS